QVFDALAEGRIHLSGLVLLATRLAPESVDELLAAAEGKSKSEIERLLAERHPRPDVGASVEPIAPTPLALAAVPGAPGHPAGHRMAGPCATEGAPGHLRPLARVSPLSTEAYAVQFTRSREQDERFRYLQDLLGHRVGRGDIAEVYARAVEELIAKME